MKKFFVLISLLAFAGCTFGGTYMYSGPGTYKDFANARYQCAASASGQSSGTYVDAYGGYSYSGQTVNCGLMDACMASKGYVRNANGHFDAEPLRVNCSR